MTCFRQQTSCGNEAPIRSSSERPSLGEARGSGVGGEALWKVLRRLEINQMDEGYVQMWSICRSRGSGPLGMIVCLFRI